MYDILFIIAGALRAVYHVLSNPIFHEAAGLAAALYLAHLMGITGRFLTGLALGYYLQFALLTM